MKKNVTISLIFATLILISIEFLSYLIYQPGHLDKIQKILEEDQNLFWRVKSEVSQLFYGSQVDTDSQGFRKTFSEGRWNSAKIKIAIMGASPSFGWGVKNNETYASLLGKKLGQDVAVKNFSQIGYSSFQGEKLLPEILATKPTHILMTYVINDLDYYRFYYGYNAFDKDIKTSAEWIIFTRNIISHLYSPRLILSFFKNQDDRHQNKPVSEITRKTRVPAKDYIENYTLMINQIRDEGMVPIIVKFPVNLPNQVTPVTKEISLKERENITIGQRALTYNQLVETIATHKKVDLIDLVKVKNQTEQYLFLDPKGDSIHLNRIGHQLFADEIYKNLNKIL